MERESAMLQAVQRQKISDVVAERIRQYIVDEKLEPGDRLPTEHALAAQFGVSRISLREATKALEFVGILEACPGRGLTVGQVDIARMSDCLRFHPGLLHVPGEQLIATRVIIETGALPHVARRMADDRSLHERLDAINAELRQTRDLFLFIERDITLHRLLVESSGLAPLVAFNDLLQVFFYRFRESVKKAEWRAGIASHQRIIDDLAAGKVEAASLELRRHIESHKKRL